MQRFSALSRWMRYLARHSSAVLCPLAVALYISLVHNGPFLSEVVASSRGDAHALGVLVSMFCLVFAPLAILLILLPGRRSFRTVAACLLVIGAAVSYFMTYYGVIVDVSMIRNIMETDAREAGPLLSAAFLTHLLAFGLLPAAIVMVLPCARLSGLQAVAVRLASVGAVLLLAGTTIYLNFGPASFFAHQSHAIRWKMNPLYPLYALYSYGTRESEARPAAVELLPARRSPAAATRDKPTLLVFVLGETARADHFSLNGYHRETNAFTRQLNLINFSDVTACGTSTADSVPCLFSSLGHDDFSHAKNARLESLLPMLERLGIEVRWRDNSTGCKDACTPAQFESVADADVTSLCADNVCVDEILLNNFSSLAAENPVEQLLVLHQRGSHGSAYHLDSPAMHKRWLPGCDSPSLQNCDRQAIINSYDNSILYTDLLLARVIEELTALSEDYDTAMLYVSDHGESLGENGLYLHGIPWSIAPEEQIKVPMVFWASDGFFTDHDLDRNCLTNQSDAAFSHDNVFSSMLGLLDVQSAAYEPAEDLFLPCMDRLRSSADGSGEPGHGRG